MEAGECGLTRGTCFAASRIELVAVREAVDFVVRFGWGGFFRVFCSFFFPFERTRPVCKYEATSCLIYLSTSNS